MSISITISLKFQFLLQLYLAMFLVASTAVSVKFIVLMSDVEDQNDHGANSVSCHTDTLDLHLRWSLTYSYSILLRQNFPVLD